MNPAINRHKSFFQSLVYERILHNIKADIKSLN